MSAMVHLIQKPAGKEQVTQMLKTLENYIKVAVDIERRILAGGGVMHADCEEVLLESGCKQKDIWGADWFPEEKRVDFRSLINIRPRQNNRVMEIQDKKIRDRVEKITKDLLQI